MSQHPSTSLVTLSLLMGESPLAFTGLLGSFLCFNILVAYGFLSKAVLSTEQTFLLPRCLEVTEQMADEHSQSINWLHGHLINIHVTTLQAKVFFLEKLLDKFTVTLDLFSVLFSFSYWNPWDVYQLSTWAWFPKVSNNHKLQMDVTGKNTESSDSGVHL